MAAETENDRLPIGPLVDHGTGPAVRLMLAALWAALGLWSRLGRLHGTTHLSIKRWCSAVYGNRANWRARLSDVVRIRWCLAQVPVFRRGSIFPRSLRYLRNRPTSL